MTASRPGARAAIVGAGIERDPQLWMRRHDEYHDAKAGSQRALPALLS
jgi:hypothetical protein